LYKVLVSIGVICLAGCSQTFPKTKPTTTGGGTPAPVPVATVPRPDDAPELASMPVASVQLDVSVGEVVQTVVVPAASEMITTRVVVTPAQVYERVVPSVVQVIDGERVVVQEATAELVEVPAVYDDVEVLTEVPAREESRVVSASEADGPQMVQVAVNPFNWDEIEAAGGRRPPIFIPPATERKYIVNPIVFAEREGADVNLKEVHKRIMGLIAAENDENFRSRLFSHPTGFVILTSPERIDDNAMAIKVNGKRIGIEENISSGFFGFIGGLFQPEPKRFRAISFTISQTVETPSVEFDTGRDFNNVFKTGGFSDFVFEDYLQRFYLRQNNFQVEVGIHEFSRVNEAQPTESYWARYVEVVSPFLLEKHKAGSNLINVTLKTQE
jgi:hypothetical protein